MAITVYDTDKLSRYYARRMNGDIRINEKSTETRSLEVWFIETALHNDVRFIRTSNFYATDEGLYTYLIISKSKELLEKYRHPYKTLYRRRVGHGWIRHIHMNRVKARYRGHGEP
jgi:hypothetical protein